MELLVYEFSEREIERYKKAKLVRVEFIPVGGCEINVSGLSAISKPRYFWIGKFGRDSPSIIVASENANSKNLPVLVNEIDVGRRLESITVRIYHNGRKGSPGYHTELTARYSD